MVDLSFFHCKPYKVSITGGLWICGRLHWKSNRIQALHAARVALSVVNAALADPGCSHEAGARARLAFRSAAGLMLAASRTSMGVGRRWSKRLITVRDLVEQNAEAGVDLVDGLAALNGESVVNKGACCSI